ncbi:MAG: adenylate kinase family protein [Candidatus Methanomethylicaceae archaeon]
MGVIVITGTPGVGKTSIAKELADRLSFRLIELNILAEEVGGIGDYEQERDTRAIKERPIRKRLREILKRGGDFIVEGHWGEIVPKEYVKWVIVLRTHPLVLMERLKKRGYKDKKVMENVQAELLDYCLIKAVEKFGDDIVFEIDSTNFDLDELVNQIVKIIEKGEGNSPGSINWITELEKEGKLMGLLSSEAIFDKKSFKGR